MRSFGKIAALVAVLCAIGCGIACRKTPPPPPAGSEPAPAAGTPAQEGMKAYVDPETGKLIDHPPPGTPPLPGDVVEPGTVVEKPAPGGGVELDLGGDENEKDDTER